MSDVKVTQLYLTLCDPIDYTVRGILQVRILERVALSLLQWIFPTQESNGGLLRCRWSLYQLSYQGSPNTRAALMHSSLFLSFVCVWSPCTRDPGPCRWGETHTVPRPPTWGHMSPRSGHHGYGPSMYEQARSLGPLGTLERSLGLVSSPLNCP